MNKVKYVRWSSIQQNGNRQLLNESDYDRIYSEQVSGSVHMEKRKEGGRLLADIKAGKVRELCVEEVSRLGRDTIDCMKTLKLCEAMGVNVVIENMGLNSIVDKKPNPCPISCKKTDCRSYSLARGVPSLRVFQFATELT